MHEFWIKKEICVQIWTNQLDCIIHKSILLRKTLFWRFLSEPYYRLPVLFIVKPIVSLCVNYLLKITSKIKPRPVDMCYTSGVYRPSGTSLYWLTPSVSTVKQFDWPELMLPIKTTRKIKLRPLGLCYPNGVDRRSGMFTNQHQVCLSLDSSIGLK